MTPYMPYWTEKVVVQSIQCDNTKHAILDRKMSCLIYGSRLSEVIA